MEVFGQMNMCLSPRTFDLELGSFLSRVEERERSRRSALISMVRDPGSTACVCRAVSSGVHVMWLDNFSKFYAVAVQRRSRRVPVGCPRASSICGTRCVHCFAARGMPSSLFAGSVISLLKQKMMVADALSEGFLKDSICFRHTVRQVPLKPEVDAKAEPAMAAVLRESRDGMRNFFPLG